MSYHEQFSTDPSSTISNVVLEETEDFTSSANRLHVMGDCINNFSSGSINRLVSFGFDKCIRVWDVDKGEVLSSQLVSDNCVGTAKLCYSRDGCRVATSYGFTIFIWNIDSQGSLELLHTVHTVHIVIFALNLNYDGSCVFSGHADGCLRRWDSESGELLWAHSTHKGKPVFAADISYDGTLIASAGELLIRIASIENGEEICQLFGHSGTVRSIQFNPDASMIASGSIDTTIRIWNVAGQHEAMVLEGHNDVVTSLSYCPDGTRLASSSRDKSVMMWDVVSGVCLFVLRDAFKNSVNSVSFNHDGSRIASGGYDRAIIIWDSVSGCEVMRLEGHSDSVTGVCYLPATSEYLLK